MTTSSTRSAGITALVLAGVADLVNIVLTYAIGSASDDAPAPVMITIVVAGLVTVGGGLLAARGRRGALIATYAARVVSAALGIPAFFLGAPVWVDVLVAVALALSVIGVWSTLPALRRPVAVRP